MRFLTACTERYGWEGDAKWSALRLKRRIALLVIEVQMLKDLIRLLNLTYWIDLPLWYAGNRKVLPYGMRS